VKRIVTPKYVEHVTMNVYVKDSQFSGDLSTLSATGKAQKGKKFFVDLLMLFTAEFRKFWVFGLFLCVTIRRPEVSAKIQTQSVGDIGSRPLEPTGGAFGGPVIYYLSCLTSQTVWIA